PELFKRHHVTFHPLDLLAAHATALDVYRNACKVRRRGFAFFRRRIAVVTAKLFLNLYRADCGVHLNGRMESLVIGIAEIVEKFTRPRTAIAAIEIEARIKTKRLSGDDRDQLFVSFELL